MIESIRPHPVVEFNPLDPEHQAALYLLIFYGRQHPTLRFFIDPSQADNFPGYAMRKTLNALMSKDVKRRALSIDKQIKQDAAQRALLVLSQKGYVDAELTPAPIQNKSTSTKVL